MYNLLQAELFKLRKSRVFSVLAGLSIIAGIGVIILLFLASKNIIYIDLSNGFTILDPQPGKKFYTTGIEIFSHTLLKNPQILVFIFSILAGFYISNDFQTGAIKNAIINGNSRISIYVAKLVAYLTGIYIIMSLFAFISTIGASMMFGIGELEESNVFLYSIRTYLLYLLQITSFATVIAMLSFFVEESGKAITLSIVSFILFLAILFVPVRYLPFFEEILSFTFLYQLESIFHELLSIEDLLKSIFAGISGIVISVTIGLHYFVRKELQ